MPSGDAGTTVGPEPSGNGGRSPGSRPRRAPLAPPTTVGPRAPAAAAGAAGRTACRGCWRRSARSSPSSSPSPCAGRPPVRRRRRRRCRSRAAARGRHPTGRRGARRRHRAETADGVLREVTCPADPETGSPAARHRSRGRRRPRRRWPPTSSGRGSSRSRTASVRVEQRGPVGWFPIADGDLDDGRQPRSAARPAGRRRRRRGVRLGLGRPGHVRRRGGARRRATRSCRTCAAGGTATPTAATADRPRRGNPDGGHPVLP
jgi:serine/threonine-protein kinase